MESNPKPSQPGARILRARQMPEPMVFAEPEDELMLTDYWSSPMGMAALADLDEDDE